MEEKNKKQILDCIILFDPHLRVGLIDFRVQEWKEGGEKKRNSNVRENID